jgi:signal transduction histidine kinase
VWESISLLFLSSFGSVWSREALTVGVAVAPLFAYVLFRIDKITDAINYFIFGNLNRHQDMLDTILNYVNTNLEDDKIIKFTDEVLSGFLESNGTHLLNLPTTDQKFNKKVEEVFIERREVYLVEEKYLAEKLKNAYCAVRFSTKINNEYIFYVENKRDDAMFSKQDMTLIKGVTNQLEYAIDRSDLYKKTKDYNVELEQKVEERTRELEIQKRTLQSMLEEKEETLHVVSHQIKTPLSVMNSAYEMWRDGLWTADKSGSVIKGELDRMKDTINIFFKAQQTDLRNKEIEFSLNDLNVLLNELVKEKKLNKKIREKQVVLTLDKSFEKLKPFYFDSRNLMEVISNLIDNAISYTKSKVDISLEMKKEKGREYLNIFVKDDGIGVEKEDMERLFERFVRGENAVKTRPDGSGLGLYICKQLMKLMHGRIWVESEGLNKGSTFFISLPYKLELKQKEV